MIALLAVTRGGARLARSVAAMLGEDVELHVAARFLGDGGEEAFPVDGPLRDRVAALFPHVDGLVFVLALGATVRLVAPLLGDKRRDPAIVVVDEAGRHVIPVVGGHQGGANALAERVAAATGGEAILTTASDALGLPAIDTLGADRGWRLDSPREVVTRVSAAVVDGQAVAIYQDAGDLDPVDALPSEWPRVSTLDELARWPGPALLISDRTSEHDACLASERCVLLRPPTLVLGMGCSLGASADELECLAGSALTEAGLAQASVALVATIDRRLSEPGVVEFAARLGAPLRGFSAEELAAVSVAPNPSSEVARHVGTPGVCEPAAILGSDGGSLIVPKMKSAMGTVAIARRAAGAVAETEGQLALVSLGPGPLDLLTPRARRALLDADTVIGYRAYLDSLRSILPDSVLRPYELGEERERAVASIELARAGRRVALVSSGDVGVYAMAGLVYELLAEAPRAQEDAMASELAVEVIPGVTAATAAAALLGAPLMLDFAVISLSDLLVSWDQIERRLEAVARGDLVLAIYNPASTRRRRGLARAKEILLAHRPDDTPVGLVREAYRPEQSVRFMTLADLDCEHVDMKTILIVGNSATAILDGRLVARRGYVRDRTAASSPPASPSRIT